MLPYQIFHRYAEQYPDAIALIYRIRHNNELVFIWHIRSPFKSTLHGT